MRGPLAVLVIAVLITACAADEPAANGREAARITEVQWRANGQLAAGDEFSAVESECIARNGEDLDLKHLTVTGFADAAPDIRDYIARNADECLTDEHLRYFFVADMENQGFTAEHAGCMAPGMLALVRRHGFAEVFDDRSVEVAGAINELRSRCGVDP